MSSAMEMSSVHNVKRNKGRRKREWVVLSLGGM